MVVYLFGPQGTHHVYIVFSLDDDDDVQIKGSTKRTLMERWEDSCLLSSSLAQVCQDHIFYLVI